MGPESMQYHYYHELHGKQTIKIPIANRKTVNFMAFCSQNWMA